MSALAVRRCPGAEQVYTWASLTLTPRSTSGMVVGSTVAAAVVCMVVFVANTRIALQVDARVVWMACRA